MNAIAADIKEAPKNFEELKWVCSTLCELLEVENNALARHDAKTVRELTENKFALAKIYAQNMLSLGSDSEIKARITQDDLAELYALGARMNGLMERNALMLKAEIEARHRLMEIFVNAAKEQNKNTITYGRQGNVTDIPLTREHAALAYNNTL
jgi:hypothetical protein